MQFLMQKNDNYCKKKLAHIKQEVMNRKDDDKYISSKKETVVKIPDEKIRAEQQKELRKIEDEIRKQEKERNRLTEEKKTAS